MTDNEYTEWDTPALEQAKEVQIAKYNCEPDERTLIDIGLICVTLAGREDE